MDATGFAVREHTHGEGWDTPETAGVRLRQARERAGLSLQDLAADLKISANYLQAIEDMDTLSLPERAYTIGFVRYYATRLGLPARELVQEFRETALGERKQVSSLHSPSGFSLPDIYLPKGLGILVAVMGMLMLAGWYGYRHDPVTHAVPPVPAALQSWAESDQLSPVPPMDGAEVAQVRQH